MNFKMKKIDKNILTACAILETNGPMGRSGVLAYMPGVEQNKVSKYCGRGVDLGLMTVETGLGTRYNYSVFTVVPNWREIADKRQPAKPAGRSPKPVVKKTRWAGIASVFQIGAA